jgi:parallel beta-helix repeat protein
VQNGATFQMNDSELHYCGYNIYSSNYNQHGLWINTNNTIIENNTFTNNFYGIIIWYSNNNTIINNTAANNTKEGVTLWGASYNTLTGNNASNNGGNGFKLYYAEYNNFSGNIATNNYNDGFYLENSSNNTLTDNTAEHNQYGFYLINGSRNNTMHSNLAINCTSQISQVTCRQGFYLDTDSYNNSLKGSFTANYLRIEVLYYNGSPVQNAEVEIKVGGNTIYSSPGFGGDNSTTNMNGLTDWILIKYQEEISGQMEYTWRLTQMNVSQGGLYINNNPRTIEHLWTSRTETFTVDNANPNVTITTPSNDTVVNTGVIYINGTYDGTGSNITDIVCNNSNFTLLTSATFGTTGTYSFVNNTRYPQVISGSKSQSPTNQA